MVQQYSIQSLLTHHVSTDKVNWTPYLHDLRLSLQNPSFFYCRCPLWDKFRSACRSLLLWSLCAWSCTSSALWLGRWCFFLCNTHFRGGLAWSFCGRLRCLSGCWARTGTGGGGAWFGLPSTTSAPGLGLGGRAPAAPAPRALFILEWKKRKMTWQISQSKTAFFFFFFKKK